MKSPQFYVRSNVHMTNLDNTIQRLLVNESLIDVTLACDGHRFQCHRLVLAAASPLFEKLLKEHPKEHPIVIIPIGVKWHILKSLIDFMYRGQTCIDQAELKTLVESAELLQVIGLYDPQTQFREIYGENDEDPSKENETNVENEESKENQETHNPEEEHEHFPNPDENENNRNEENDDNVEMNRPELEEDDDAKKKEFIVDYIEIDDSQDETSQPAQGYLITKDKTTMTSEENLNIVTTSSVEIQTDSPTMKDDSTTIDEMENETIQTVPNTIAHEATTQTISTAAATKAETETETTSTIRVKPAIKLINLFKLNRPGDGNQSPSKVPWTYIHIPATAGAGIKSPGEQVPIITPFVGATNIAMPRLMQMPVRAACPVVIAKPVQESNDISHAAKMPVPSFLKFNSSSMAISVKNLDRTKDAEKLNVLNMAVDSDSNQHQQQLNQDDGTNDVRGGCHPDDLNEELPIGRIKDEVDVKAESMDFSIDMDRPDNPIGQIETEAENIICQPNVSYIYDGNDADDYGKDVDDVDDDEVGVCIDYDRLVAETYGNMEQKIQPKAKKKSSTSKKCKKSKATENSKNSSTMGSSMKNDHNHVHHNHHQRLKEPPTLVPLSVMNAGLGPKHLYHCKNNNSPMNFDEKIELYGDIGDNTIQADSSDSHTQNAVILRNPRCNQPRHYSNESLYAALMAVKYGDSIYRASRLHKVPRKTLRNWMKRWDIKSQYPMPKQLKDAAKKKKLIQNQCA